MMSSFTRRAVSVALAAGLLMGTALTLPQTARAADELVAHKDKNPVVQIYHLEGRRSFRAIWTAEELGIPYELMFKPGDFKASAAMMYDVNPYVPMWPTAKFGDTVIVESGAIVEALVNVYGKGKLVPKLGTPEYYRYLQWMHFAEGTAMYRIYAFSFAAKVANIPVQQVPVGRTPDGKNTGPVGIQAVMDFMEDHLSRYPYMAGNEFTAADIMMQFVVNAAKLTGGFDTVNFKNVLAWNDRIKARPAFQRAMAASVPQGANEYGLPKDMKLPFPEPDPSLPKPVPTVLPKKDAAK